MTRKHFLTGALVAAGLLAVAAIPSCTLQPPAGPTGGTTNVSQNQTVIIGNPNPSASPSPGAGGTIHHVGVFNVGTEGTAAKCVSTDPHTLHVGCKIWLTCTPKFQDGTDVPEAVHGPAPDSFGATVGAAFVTIEERSGQTFDINVIGKAAGSSVISCVVKGIVSRPFEFTVVN
jgi:hypothetical protein